MDAVEKAVRNALEKGNATDPAFRRRVYESAASALDRAIAAKPDLPAGTAERRRAQLADRIADIETEFVPAASPAPEVDMPAPGEQAPAMFADHNEPEARQPAPTQEPEPAATPGPTPRSFEAHPANAPATDDEEKAGETSHPQTGFRVNDLRPADDRAPVASGDDSAIGSIDDDFTPQGESRAAPIAAGAGASEIGGVDAPYRDAPTPRGRRTAIRFVTALLVVAALAVAGWWLLQGGSRPASDEGDGTLAPVASDNGGSGEPEPGAIKAGEDWVTVFSPADPTRVTAPAGASAASKVEGDLHFLRIKSGTADAPFVFKVGQGILETLAGSRAVFRVVARAPDGAEVQMAVDCDFGTFGDCGRKRYAVGPTSADYLLETDFPDSNPAGGGTISITPDIGDGGKAIDILAIQASKAR